MRIVSWNCNMAFRKKWESIIDFNSDIIFVQECESPQKFINYKSMPNLNQFLWFGDNVNKGLGVFTFNDFFVSTKKINQDFKYVIPLKINNGSFVLNTFMVWAMPHSIKKNSYVGQLWNAFNYYKFSQSKNYMIIGDWNSHKQWDNERKTGNHSMLIDRLAKRNIVSAYHYMNKLEQGDELDPTFFLLKKKNKPYHMDYCAVSNRLISSESTIKIGTYDHWIKYSDHMPLFIELRNLNH